MVRKIIFYKRFETTTNVFGNVNLSPYTNIVIFTEIINQN